MSFCINHTDTRYTFCFHVICRAFTSYDISIHVLVVGIFCLEEVESRNWLYGCRSSWIFQRNFALPVPPLSAAQLLSGLRPTFPALHSSWQASPTPWCTATACIFLGKPSLSACFLANLHYLHVWLEFECHKLPLVVFEQFRPVVQLVWLQLWVISWLGVFHIVYDQFLDIQMYTVHAWR